MPQPEWEACQRELRELAERVARIEQYAGLSAPAAAQPPVPDLAEYPTVLTDHPLAGIPNLLPVIGRALLGLAGAYLLRALTESGTVPARLGIAIGIAYALGWLGLAARRPLEERWSAAIDSLTSVLILSPLLWEATARFHLLSSWTAAAVLLIFAVFGMTISWRKSLLIVSTFATLASLGTGAALLLATHDVLPFTFLFLATAAAIETSACLDHYLSERWLGATAADLAVLLATWLVTNERGLPPTYSPIPGAWLVTGQVALLTIYLFSIIVRTLLRGRSLTVFEMVQCAIAFSIGLSGGLRTAPVMAGVMVGCAAACYLASFALLERRETSSRNFYAYSTFGIVLALAGSRILLSGATASWIWFALAVALVWTGGSFGRLTLQVHGAIYLLLALATSGALRESAGVLLGAAGQQSERQIELWTGLAASAAAYALTMYRRIDGSPSTTLRGCRLAIAATFVWLAAAAAAGQLIAGHRMMFGHGAADAYCATIRTGVLACLALLLAWAGKRWNRSELSLLAYPAMLLGGYRLLAWDIHQGEKVALFLSLLLLGGTLTVLPRLVRR
jgi:hypothetical protein